MFTEDPTLSPVVEFAASGGSYETYNASIKALGTTDGVGYIIAGNHFETDGYRAHSAATRDIVNARKRRVLCVLSVHPPRGETTAA